MTLSTLFASDSGSTTISIWLVRSGLSIRPGSVRALQQGFASGQSGPFPRVSRAIAGSAPFVPTLVASAVLLALHWLFSAGAVRWHRFGVAIKGRTRVLINDGRIDAEALRAAHMSDRDLWEDLRSKSIADLNEVAQARLERSGNLSVIKAKRKPKVIEVAVAEGVQTVRVELH
jgi:uncharacterized membrane protein YcaP (DUF421 family)